MSAVVGIRSLLGVLGSGPADLGLYVVDGAGQILERSGRAAGPGVGEFWDAGMAASGAQVRLALSGGCQLVAHGPLGVDLVDALAHALTLEAPAGMGWLRVLESRAKTSTPAQRKV